MATVKLTDTATPASTSSGERTKRSSGPRGKPLDKLLARVEQQYPGIEESIGMSSAALRAGQLVRAMRKARHLTQTQLAEALGWDQVRISNIERGEGTRGPTFDVLQKIAAACHHEIQFMPLPAAELEEVSNTQVGRPVATS